MQARHSAPEPQPVCGEEADAAATSYKEATLDNAPRAPFLSPVVPSKRAAPKAPRPVPGAPSLDLPEGDQEVDAAARAGAAGTS